MLPSASVALLPPVLLSHPLSHPAQSQSISTDKQPASDSGVYNVRTFGAKGDGTTLDTNAFQHAIDTCSNSNGGTVWVPAGNFIIGTVELKSNVSLHLEPLARIAGSGDPAQYSAGKGIPPRNGNVVLLYAANANNIAITGTGTIDGQGKLFFKGKGDSTGPGEDSSKGYFQRPHMFIFYRCQRLLIRDVSCQESAYHGMRILECSDVHLNGIRIHNRSNFNNDGFHIVSCSYVNISDCNVRSEDDSCALFGSNQYVTVTNCTFSTRWSVFRFGGGHAKDIVISNCVIYRTYGCAIKIDIAAKSSIERVSFSNLILDRVTGPIWIALNAKGRGWSVNDAPETEETKPFARNISFSNIRGVVVAIGEQFDDVDFHHGYPVEEAHSCITLNGVGDGILQNISFDNVHLTYAGGGTASDAARRDMPQISGEYFVMGTPPAYGMYARNVRGLTMQNVRFQIENPDARPAVVFDRVEDLAINGFSAQGSPEAESLLRFQNSGEALLSACRVFQNTSVFLQVEGEQSRDIVIDGGNLHLAKVVASTQKGAKEGSVLVRK